MIEVIEQQKKMACMNINYAHRQVNNQFQLNESKFPKKTCLKSQESIKLVDSEANQKKCLCSSLRKKVQFKNEVLVYEFNSMTMNNVKFKCQEQPLFDGKCDKKRLEDVIKTYRSYLPNKQKY